MDAAPTVVTVLTRSPGGEVTPHARLELSADLCSRYRLREPRGSRAMDVLYEAEQVATGRRVAEKFLIRSEDEQVQDAGLRDSGGDRSMRRRDELISIYGGQSPLGRKVFVYQMEGLSRAFDSEELLDFLHGQKVTYLVPERFAGEEPWYRVVSSRAR